jgi:hypothetical protein
MRGALIACHDHEPWKICKIVREVKRRAVGRIDNSGDGDGFVWGP